MALEDAAHEFQRGNFKIFDKKYSTSTNYMPDGLLEIICILERGEKHNSYKIICKRLLFFSQIFCQELRIDTIEELCFRSTSSNSSGKERFFFPRTSYQIKGESVKGSNLHMLLDLQVNIRIRRFFHCSASTTEAKEEIFSSGGRSTYG